MAAIVHHYGVFGLGREVLFGSAPVHLTFSGQWGDMKGAFPVLASKVNQMVNAAITIDLPMMKNVSLSLCVYVCMFHHEYIAITPACSQITP